MKDAVAGVAETTTVRIVEERSDRLRLLRRAADAASGASLVSVTASTAVDYRLSGRTFLSSASTLTGEIIHSRTSATSLRSMGGVRFLSDEGGVTLPP